jgi:hypothetical protein
MPDDETSPAEDLYAAQRAELMTLLLQMKKTGEGLVIHGEPRLTSDDATAILQKLGRGAAFSRRERAALSDAGFNLPGLYPDL